MAVPGVRVARCGKHACTHARAVSEGVSRDDVRFAGPARAGDTGRGHGEGTHGGDTGRGHREGTRAGNTGRGHGEGTREAGARALTWPRCLAAAVSYANYKKTPPPVPPRTTSKPLIAVTAQSSTESTQDAYQDGRAPRASPWTPDGRGLYNSTDSLDSTKALSLALQTATQRHGDGPGRGDKALLAAQAEDFLRGRLTSIGVQVASRSLLTRRHGSARVA